MGGGTMRHVAASSVGNGEFEVFTVSADGRLWRQAPWSGINAWQAMNGWASKVAATKNPDGRVEVAIPSHAPHRGGDSSGSPSTPSAARSRNLRWSWRSGDTKGGGGLLADRPEGRGVCMPGDKHKRRLVAPWRGSREPARRGGLQSGSVRRSQSHESKPGVANHPGHEGELSVGTHSAGRCRRAGCSTAAQGHGQQSGCGSAQPGWRLASWCDYLSGQGSTHLPLELNETPMGTNADAFLRVVHD